MRTVRADIDVRETGEGHARGKPPGDSVNAVARARVAARWGEPRRRSPPTPPERYRIAASTGFIETDPAHRRMRISHRCSGSSAAYATLSHPPHQSRSYTSSAVAAGETVLSFTLSMKPSPPNL